MSLYGECDSRDGSFLVCMWYTCFYCLFPGRRFVCLALCIIIVICFLHVSSYGETRFYYLCYVVFQAEKRHSRFVRKRSWAAEKRHRETSFPEVLDLHKKSGNVSIFRRLEKREKRGFCWRENFGKTGYTFLHWKSVQKRLECDLTPILRETLGPVVGSV